MKKMRQKGKQGGAPEVKPTSGASPEKKTAPAPRKKGKKDPNDRSAEDVAELEQVIEDLRAELRFRDEDFTELRDEVEVLRAQNEQLRKSKNVVTHKAIALEAQKVKYAY